ncbi:hypothetical protein DQG23_36735 [Paenibacillus contaminans]|uniref:HD/PDEase domain-containing protein n=2 Tax=Paenibacillus contaminans TaxID=450362 RepID=A0A329M2D4_9BACL|nr:hypothetical protein DQG23_36735 [Paenibacillus contaminans]
MILDPVHENIIITDNVINDLIQASAFQRLKGLKQQGNTYFLLSNTTHNRYSHSLGVYENMRKMINQLTKNDMLFTDNEIEIALISALMHDIGHGPYSHCFEHITDIHHEKWTVRIIRENAEISSILSGSTGLLEAVIAVIERTGEYPLIEELLFSQIGADKLDYHLRDLYFSEISQEPYSLEGLIGGLHFHSGKLVLDSNAIQEVEKFILIKRKLFEQGFNHPDVIGKDVLLKLLFRRAKYLFEHKELDKFPAILTSLFVGEYWTLDNYLQLNDQVIFNIVQDWSENRDLVMSELSNKYISSIEASIKWIELNDDLVEHIKLTDPYTSQLFTQDEKYVCYRAGIYVLDKSGRLVDICEKSQTIKQHSTYKPKKYFYYLG